MAAVLLGVDGISDFDGLYSGKHNDEVQLYAFDILALDVATICGCSLYACARPTLPACWPAAPTASTLRHSSKARSGRGLFRHACKFGLEGMVSERHDSAYRFRIGSR